MSSLSGLTKLIGTELNNAPGLLAAQLRQFTQTGM
jgi:hypothetical protein